MRRTFRILFAIGSVAAFLSINSCTVTCDAGYEGKGCATPMNAKFAGTYSVSDTLVSISNTQVLNYYLEIVSLATTPANIIIYNLHNLGSDSTVAGTVSGNSLTIPAARIDTLFVSSASGSINDTTISIYYTLSDSNFLTQTCHAVGSR